VVWDWTGFACVQKPVVLSLLGVTYVAIVLDAILLLVVFKENYHSLLEKHLSQALSCMHV